MPTVDVFVDASRLPGGVSPLGTVDRLVHQDLLGAIAHRIFCAVPASFATSTVQRGRVVRIVPGPAARVFSLAMTAAADAERPLLVLLGLLEPRAEAVGVMLEALREDPMIGFAVARLTGSRDDSLATLDKGGDRAIAELPRRILAELPETYLVADAPARCLLIAPAILGNFETVDERFRSVAGGLWHYVSRARRCGFRTVVCNRAVVSAVHGDDACGACVITPDSLPRSDRALLRDLAPDIERAHEEFGTRALAPLETRVARALPKAYGSRPSLLLDVRNIGRAMNGTAISALGIAEGLHALHAEWDVALLARRDASTAHNLEERFRDWPVHTTLPERQFSVAVRLSQPWHIEEMVELHSLAATNIYLFLDTISWDAAYPAPRQLDGTWRFLADHADGFLFDSEFTRQRFYRRFATATARPSLVCHYSFEPTDYIRSDVDPASDAEGPIFVIGNSYDHKDVGQTIDVLARAFPYQSIVALGPVPAPTPRVRVLESGALAEIELHRLYAGARMVVFPSFYEGFGFPTVTTLAYGRTLLARRSPLLEEIAAHCSPRGRIVPYDRRDDLVELVGRLLHGQAVPELQLGAALAHRRPKSWPDIGASVLAFVAALSGDLSRSHWRAREHTIRQLLAARGDASAAARSVTV